MHKLRSAIENELLELDPHTRGNGGILLLFQNRNENTAKRYSENKAYLKGVTSFMFSIFYPKVL